MAPPWPDRKAGRRERAGKGRGRFGSLLTHVRRRKVVRLVSFAANRRRQVGEPELHFPEVQGHLSAQNMLALR